VTTWLRLSAGSGVREAGRSPPGSGVVTPEREPAGSGVDAPSTRASAAGCAAAASDGAGGVEDAAVHDSAAGCSGGEHAGGGRGAASAAACMLAAKAARSTATTALSSTRPEGGSGLMLSSLGRVPQLSLRSLLCPPSARHGDAAVCPRRCAAEGRRLRPASPVPARKPAGRAAPRHRCVSPRRRRAQGCACHGVTGSPGLHRRCVRRSALLCWRS
jgi:hypothetical protein